MTGTERRCDWDETIKTQTSPSSGPIPDDRPSAGVHDVIGTRCDPYTNLLLKGTEYHHCCQSNLTRALASEQNLPLEEAEVHVHDVMNIFMCTSYTRETHQYFMKASPVRIFCRN